MQAIIIIILIVIVLLQSIQLYFDKLTIELKDQSIKNIKNDRDFWEKMQSDSLDELKKVTTARNRLIKELMLLGGLNKIVSIMEGGEEEPGDMRTGEGGC